jgi:hypothetical protein
MGFFKDENDVMIGSSRVSVTGATGLVHATWTLAVDGSPVDSAAAAGNFTLRGELPDGSTVRAEIFQSLMGPTEVAVIHDDEEVARFKGFVA